ncbi:MAG: GNAT family N-acetyltransferase [Mariniphaga sp.]
MIENVNNLFGFYRETGSCPSVSFTETLQFSAVSGAENSWPQLVFDIDFQGNAARELNHVLIETVNRKLPAFAVCNAVLFGEKELDYLRQNEIYPVRFWTLMHAFPQSMPKNPNGQQSEKTEFRKLLTDAELEEFTALVNAEFIQNASFSVSLAKELNANDGVGFYGLFTDGKLVSGLQTFSNNQTTGLYFIATNSNYRGRGFATELIRQVMGTYLKNSRELVLQAVQKAVPLYQRLGFSEEGKLVIFWKKENI